MRVELRDIHKYYGAVRANVGIHLEIEPGNVYGILGENGAGKSTLMKILAGFTRQTAGQIIVDGQPVDFNAPAQASRAGIGMLYQEPLDFPVLSLLENFMVGQAKGLLARRRKFKATFDALAEKLGFLLPAGVRVASLTLGERQQLEILRLMAQGIGLLILDEPTTGISSLQKEILFEALRQLAADGKTVVLVSHKLEDVETLCDHVFVLRGGTLAGAMARPFESRRLLELMFGTHPVSPSRSGTRAGRPVLSLAGVSARGGRSGLKNCSLTLHQGELVGLAGLEASGQEVFLRVGAGLVPAASGTVFLQGSSMKGRDHHGFQSAGTLFLPTSRLEEGLIAGLNITEHFALQDHQRSFWVQWSRAVEKARSRIERFRIKGRPQTRVEALSGGNQQRLLLSFIPKDPGVLLLENPTRGLDLESANWVWQHLHDLCRKGTCIAFSSAELDEILMVADRVLVFFEGRIIKDVATGETDIQALGQAIAGRI